MKAVRTQQKERRKKEQAGNVCPEAMVMCSADYCIYDRWPLMAATPGAAVCRSPDELLASSWFLPAVVR